MWPVWFLFTFQKTNTVHHPSHTKGILSNLAPSMNDSCTHFLAVRMKSASHFMSVTYLKSGKCRETTNISLAWDAGLWVFCLFSKHTFLSPTRIPFDAILIGQTMVLASLLEVSLLHPRWTPLPSNQRSREIACYLGSIFHALLNCFVLTHCQKWIVTLTCWSRSGFLSMYSWTDVLPSLGQNESGFFCSSSPLSSAYLLISYTALL